MIIQGLTSAGISKPLLVDASGNAIVSPALLTSSGLAVALDASQRIKILLDAQTGNLSVNLAAQGYTPSVSVTNIGESAYDSKVSQVYNTALAAGTNNIDFAAVTAGQSWILKSYSFFYAGVTAGVFVRPSLVRGAGVYTFNQHVTLTSAVYYGYHCDIPFAAGDVFRMVVAGATLNDDFLCNTYFKRVQ